MWILRRGLWVRIGRGWGRLRSGCFSHVSIYLAICLFVCLFVEYRVLLWLVVGE